MRADAERLLGSRFISGTLVAVAAFCRSLGTTRSERRADEFARLESALVDLSRIFYYAEGRGETATLRDELGFAERYLRLQAFRFGDRLSYRVAADEGILDRAVPRLASFGPLELVVADALELSVGKAFIAVEALPLSHGGLELRIARGRSSGAPIEDVRAVRMAERPQADKALSRNSRKD
jgi:Histidine kinase